MDRDYINNIKLPKNIDSVIDNAISRGERKKRKNKNIAKVAAVAILISSVTLFNLTSQSFADNIPFLGKVFENVTVKVPGQDPNYHGSDINYNKYAEGINATQTYGNTSIKIDQAVCDGNYILLSVVINCKDGFGNVYLNKSEGMMAYDFVRFDFENHYQDEFNDTLIKKFVNFKNEYPYLQAIQSYSGKFVDNNTYIGIAKYDLSRLNKEIPDKFKFKLNIKELDYSLSKPKDKPAYIKGSWNFEFEMSKLNSSQIKTITPFVKIGDLTVDKVIITPLSTNITFSIPEALVKDQPSIPLLYDENDNEVMDFLSPNKIKNGDRICYICNYPKLPDGSKNMKLKLKYDSKDFITIPLTQN